MRYSHSREGIIIYLVIAVVYGIFRLWTSYPVLSTVISVVIIIAVFFGNKILIDWDNRNRIRQVRRTYVTGQNTIANSNCTVKLFPKDKLIVMENAAKYNKKQMFTLLKKDGFNINKGWADICRVFDDYTTLNSITMLLDVPRSYIITLESSPKPEPRERVVNIGPAKPKYVNLNDVTPDTSNIPQNTTPNSSNQPTVNMDQLLAKSANSIDINNAQAAELAILPGINIVLAKKLIEYRNTHGKFSDVNEFFKEANLKPHFVEKITPMIVLGEIKPFENNDDDEGRIVDF